jgi:tRNA-specific adenosine deaminase 3
MALVHSRIGRVFYGVPDQSKGALGSKIHLHTEARLNHRFEVGQPISQRHSTALSSFILFGFAF